MNRRNFLSGLLATAGGLVLPEPERVRAYSFMPGEPYSAARDWLRVERAMSDGFAEGVRTFTGARTVTLFGDGTVWTRPADTWEIRDTRELRGRYPFGQVPKPHA